MTHVDDSTRVLLESLLANDLTQTRDPGGNHKGSSQKYKANFFAKIIIIVIIICDVKCRYA